MPLTGTELRLFEMLAMATMDQGGHLEVLDFVLLREEDKYVSRRQGGDLHGSWAGLGPILEDLYAHLKQKQKTINDVAFFAEPGITGTAGVPWSFLKKDMSFLRIVLGNDSTTLRSIITRLEGILTDALSGKEENRDQTLRN